MSHPSELRLRPPPDRSARPGLVTIALVFLVIVLAGSAATLAQRYPVRVYTEQDGLPSSTVHDVLQDSSGFIWAATRAGIARYDGASWRVWSDIEGMRASSFGAIAEGAGETLWAITDVNPFYLAEYREGEWIPRGAIFRDGPEFKELTVDLLVAQGPDGDLPILVTSLGRVVAWKDGQWWPLVPADFGGPGEPEPIHCAALDGDSLLLGLERGLHRVPIDGPRSLRPVPGLEGRRVTGISRRDRAGGWWVAGERWAGSWADGRLDLLVEGVDLCRYPSWCGMKIVSDAGRGLWLVSLGQVTHVLDSGAIERLGVSHGLGGEGGRALLRDRQNNVWIAGDRALSKLRAGRLLSYDQRQGLLTDEVTSVLQTRDGSIWLGHPGGLTRLVDDRPVETLRLSGDPQLRRVMGLGEDARGSLWIAPVRGALLRRDPVDGRVIEVPLPVEEALQHVTGLQIRADGSMWVSGAFGLLRWKDGVFHAVPLPGSRDNRPPYLRNVIDGGSHGLLLPAIGRGLIRLPLDGGPPSHHVLESGGHVNSMFTAITDGGNVLAGSARGLYRLNAQDELVPAGPPDYPEVHRPVYFLEHDREGRLWIGTDYGAMRWDGEELLHVTVHQGLLGHETNRDAGFLDDRGRFWIGTNAGVSVYREWTPEVEPAPPSIELARVALEGRSFPFGVPARVTARTAGLTVSFHVLSFIDETRARVESRLEGLEQEWQPGRVLPRRELRYPRLGPGTYRLHLRAIAADGTAGPATSTETLVVSPPFWMSGWFRVLSLLALLGLVLGGAGLVMQRRTAGRLEREVRRRTEELEASREELARAHRLESLGRMAGGIAHDFNNLLTVLIGNLSMLELLLAEGGDREEMRPLVSDMSRAAGQAKDLARQLLTFSRGGDPVLRPLDLHGLVDQARAVSLSGSGTTVRLDLPEELPPVQADSAQMAQVLQNLLINADQAMGGSGQIRIRARELEAGEAGGLEGARAVLLEIEDDGPGMPAQTLGQIFDPYFSTKPDGTGLGLAIAHSVVRRHGGRITAESEPERGTRFRIALPASPSAAAVSPEPPPVSVGAEVASEPAAEPDPAVRAPRVLVMDDEQAIRRVVERLLERLGCETVGCAEGGEAIEAYRSALESGSPFHLVIMDLTVAGGMGGREAAKVILELDPEARVLVASGYSSDPVMGDPAKHGFAGALQKPFRKQDLEQALADLLRS